MVDAEAATPIEVAELRFRRGCWSRTRRVVLTRRRDAETPQGHLGDAAGYHDAAYVTDGDWAPEDVVAVYDKRADMEKAIHELKTFSGSCQAIFLERCRSCCRAIVARWYDSSYGTRRSQRTKIIAIP